MAQMSNRNPKDFDGDYEKEIKETKKDEDYTFSYGKKQSSVEDRDRDFVEECIIRLLVGGNLEEHEIDMAEEICSGYPDLKKRLDHALLMNRQRNTEDYELYDGGEYEDDIEGIGSAFWDGLNEDEPTY